MFLRSNRRFKDGKEHRYWNIVENKRCAGGQVVQRQVLYLGEINDSQFEAWCQLIDAFDEGSRRHRQLALFPADREVPECAEGYGVQVRLDAMELHRPRQWGACWLACQLYKQLELDQFWSTRLPDSRKGTQWRHILQTLVCYRLIDPGSEWRLHRLWFEQSAMGDLLGADYALVQRNALYRCLDKLLEHKTALFDHLRERWQDLFGASFEVLLYDLTNLAQTDSRNQFLEAIARHAVGSGHPKILIDDMNALRRPAERDGAVAQRTRILQWVGLKTPPDSSNLGPLLLIAVFLFCAGIIAIDAIDPGRVATWFPRGVAVPIIFGAWLPLLSFLSALGRQYKAPFIVALAVAAAGLTFLFGDNHSVRRIDATAQQPERPSKPN